MRRDRTGEPIEDDQPEAGHWCRKGWLDRNATHPRPCLRCRPWLAERPPRPPTKDELKALSS